MTVNADPQTHLTILKARNSELERRLNKLKGLSVTLEENINKIQTMFDQMISSQENQCFDMVQFDEEIKQLSKSLFPPASQKNVTPRRREENSNLIMSQILSLQRLEPKQCEEQLQESDPLYKRVRQDTRLMQKFLAKYNSFL
ncbi:hypothetical protein M9Y10_036281 [Tritrichomonas musculus]|uniref:Uncharacterized protein n=1 Tax=Tritrichomonas musculus TaxID=1915356 RepID=A0ABR2GV51_9EUKA